MAIHRTSTELDERSLFAEYPFLPGAERLVGDLPVSVRELLTDPAYERARGIGRARVLAAADDPRGGAAISELSHATREERFLSFLFARIVLSASATGAGLRRWAVAESKRTSSRLDSASLDELNEVARRLGFSFEPEAGRVTLTLVDYLQLATAIREGEFRLVRQSVAHGRVGVSRERAARLLQEGIRRRLATPSALGDDVVGAIRQQESELLEEVARRVPAPVARGGTGPQALQPTKFPPCMRKMRRMLEAGENLSHAGRFALAAFLHRAGADFETIVDAYRGAPDFEESVTRYQVEHITQRDGGRGYEPPECETLRSHGLCFREGDPAAPSPPDRSHDSLCFEPFLRHPLQYYRIRGGAVVDRDPDGSSTAGEKGSGTPSAPGRSPSSSPR
jgi:DNA primase large subunit